MNVWLLASNAPKDGKSSKRIYKCKMTTVRWIEVTHVAEAGALYRVDRKFENNCGDVLFDIGVLPDKVISDWLELGSLGNVIKTNMMQKFQNKAYGDT